MLYRRMRCLGDVMMDGDVKSHGVSYYPMLFL